MRRVIATAWVLVLAAGPAACGGGGGDFAGRDPTAWTVDVCTAFSSWRDRLEERVATLEQETTEAVQARGLPGARAALVEYAADITVITEDMRDEVAAAGTPGVEEGAAIRRDIVAGLDEFVRVFERLKGRIEEFPVDDPEAFGQAADDLDKESSTAFEGFERRFDAIDEKYDADEIDEAFQEEEACAFLREEP